MFLVELVFRSVQRPPPIPETAAPANTRQVGVDHNPIHAVVIAVKEFFVPVVNASAITCVSACSVRQTPLSALTRKLHACCPEGATFSGAVPKKHSFWHALVTTPAPMEIRV